jgi:hypothetical protein
MKPAINITATILACGLAAGLASAQSPRIIQNTRSTMNGVSNNAAAASNQALGTKASSAATTNAAHVPSKSVAPAHVAPVKTASSEMRRRHERRRVVGVVAVPGAVVAVPNAVEEAPAAGNDVASNDAAGAANAERAANGTAPDSKYSANGRRDPFVSPVVSHAGGSGCSTGKKCLEIGAINLRGVVHSDGGFIAVVSNSLNKAYFLRENDPVFNGYVVKITGDSIVFQETVQDRLGKTFTREVVKKITTPAV